VRGGMTLSNSPTTFQSSIPQSTSQSDYNSSINMQLPADWLSGTVDLTVRIDPDNRIAESNESNNVVTLRLAFTPVPPLRIKIVPIRYTHTLNGITYPAPTLDTISSWISRVYPISQVDISWHAAYSFTGNLKNTSDWQKLLDEITALKSSEGAPSSQVYYGLIPVSNGSSTWFNGGVAGIGWVNSRTAIGLNTSSSAGQIAAHEVGHNLGMWHAPCGNASGVDPEFPYTTGSIGTYGLDVLSGIVYAPESTRDLMSYCSPKWISDYTYKKLYAAQIRYGASQELTLSAPVDGSQRSLLVRARLNEQGAEFLPLYILPAQSSAPAAAGQYTVQMLDHQGNVLSETPVQELSAAEDGLEFTAIQAVIPPPRPSSTTGCSRCRAGACPGRRRPRRAPTTSRPSRGRRRNRRHRS